MTYEANLTQDIDVIVDSDPSEARNVLLQANARFTMTPSSKLVFSGEGDKSITVELLRGGEGRGLKLPDANAVSLRPITANDLPGRVGETPSEYLCIQLESAFANQSWCSSPHHCTLRPRPYQAQEMGIHRRLHPSSKSQKSSEGHQRYPGNPDLAG